MTTTNKKFDVNVMRDALIEAKRGCNRHVIRKKDADEAGVPQRMFERYVEGVNKLRLAITPYVKAKLEKPVDAEKCDELRGKIFPMWEELLKAGEEDLEDQKMEATEYDVDSLVGFAETYIGSKKGTLWAVQTSQKFRKDVEAFLGCKIIVNSVLEDEERDLIKTYERSLKIIVENKKEIDGYKDKEGKHVNGKKDEIQTRKDEIGGAENTIMKMKTLKKDATGDALEFFESQAEFLRKSIKTLEKEIEDLEGEVKTLEKDLKNAEEYVAEKKADYEKLMATINE